MPFFILSLFKPIHPNHLIHLFSRSPITDSAVFNNLHQFISNSIIFSTKTLTIHLQSRNVKNIPLFVYYSKHWLYAWIYTVFQLAGTYNHITDAWVLWFPSLFHHYIFGTASYTFFFVFRLHISFVLWGAASRKLRATSNLFTFLCTLFGGVSHSFSWAGFKTAYILVILECCYIHQASHLSEQNIYLGKEVRSSFENWCNLLYFRFKQSNHNWFSIHLSRRKHKLDLSWKWTPISSIYVVFSRTTTQNEFSNKNLRKQAGHFQCYGRWWWGIHMYSFEPCRPCFQRACCHR